MTSPLTSPAPLARAGDSALLRAVGFIGLAGAVLNISIGGSIFALPGTLASSMGSAAPLAFVLGALLFLPIVLCMAAAGSRIVATGGPYSYVDAAFGRFPGFVVAAVFWISNVVASGGIAAVLVDQFSHLYPALHEPLPRALFLMAVYAALVLLNARGVRVGAQAIVAFAAAKTVPLLLLGLIGVHYMHFENLRIAALPGWGTVGNSLVLVLFAYSGFELALAPSGEVRDPAKVVPLAALTGVSIAITLYIAMQLLAEGVLGHSLAGSTAPLPAVADAIYHGAGGLLVLTATISLVGFLQGDLLANSRLLYAMANKGFLPAPLATVTAKNRVPMRAVFAHALIAWSLAAAGTFTKLALLSGGTIGLVYIACCAAAWRLQRTNAGDTTAPFRLAGGPLIPIIGILGLVFLLSTLQRAEWIAIGWAMLAVSALYVVARRTIRQ